MQLHNMPRGRAAHGPDRAGHKVSRHGNIWVYCILLIGSKSKSIKQMKLSSTMAKTISG